MRLSTRRAARATALTASLLITFQPLLAKDDVADCHGEPSVCRTLVRGERDLASMLVSGDTSIVARLFADDAVWSLGNGQRWTRVEAIAALRKAPRMTSSKLVRASVHQHGTVAIVVWNESWHDPANNREEQSFGTDTWMLKGAEWQIIASQEARPIASTRR
jgi:hypothetical protein